MLNQQEYLFMITASADSNHSASDCRVSPQDALHRVEQCLLSADIAIAIRFRANYGIHPCGASFCQHQSLKQKSDAAQIKILYLLKSAEVEIFSAAADFVSR